MTMQVRHPAAYTRQELMVIEAARQLRDGEIVFVGTGFPLLAQLSPSEGMPRTWSWSLRAA